MYTWCEKDSGLIELPIVHIQEESGGGLIQVAAGQQFL